MPPVSTKAPTTNGSGLHQPRDSSPPHVQSRHFVSQGLEKVLRDYQRAVAQMRKPQTSQGERIPINSQSLNY